MISKLWQNKLLKVKIKANSSKTIEYKTQLTNKHLKPSSQLNLKESKNTKKQNKTTKKKHKKT